MTHGTRLDAGALLDDVALPFPVVRCHGKHLEACFTELRTTYPGAVIVGTRDNLLDCLDLHEDWRAPSEILALADGSPFAQVHEARFAEASQDVGLDRGGDGVADALAEFGLDEAEAMLGALIQDLDLGDSVRKDGMIEADAVALLEEIEKAEAEVCSAPDAFQSIARDVLTNAWLDELYIALLPAAKAAEIPAHYDSGGWNDMPMGEEHVVYMRHWAKTYGAELVGFAFDTVTFKVANPPKTEEAALALAKEHFGYCYDRVEQGSGSIEALAVELLGAKDWVFWWD